MKLDTMKPSEKASSPKHIDLATQTSQDDSLGMILQAFIKLHNFRNAASHLLPLAPREKHSDYAIRM